MTPRPAIDRESDGYCFPKERTPGLVWEFQVWFTWNGNEPTSRLVTAATEAQARMAIPSPPAVISAVNVVRPILDPARTWLCLAAAAAYLGVPPSAVQAMMAEGQLPRPKQGRPMFHRDWLDEVMQKRTGKDDCAN